MLKHYLLSLTMVLCFSLNIANATSINSPAQKSGNDSDASDDQQSTTAQLSSDSPFNLSPSGNEAWIKQKLGNDFYTFYDKKTKNKPSEKASLKIDYYLNASSKVNTSSKINVEKNQLLNLPAIVKINLLPNFSTPAMRFSDDELEWNPADITIIELSDDYKKFVDDEVLAGKTYREFWDGEETTEFEDFIDEHFGFHDNALFRALIVLAGFLALVLTYAYRAKLAALISPEDNAEELE